MSGGGEGEGGKLPSVDHDPLNEGRRDKKSINPVNPVDISTFI